MKKITALLLILILLVGSVGCSSTPSEPASGNNNEDTQTNNTNNQGEKLKTYYEVMYDGEFLDALNYFDEKYEDFDDESRNQYKSALREELTKKGEKYKVFAEIERDMPEFPAPGTIEYVDLFYPNVFDSEKYTFNINTLDDELKNTAKELKEDKIFSLCKAYWATEGYIEDIGFEAIVNRDVYLIIESRLLDGEDDAIENVHSYTDHIGSMDSVFESDAKYPTVLVENTDKLDLFKDAFKTTLYIPVKIIEEPVEEVEETPAPTDNTSSNDKTEETKEEIPENKVIKNYDGVGLDTLGQKTYDFKFSEEYKDITNKINKSLAVFGTIYDVEIGQIRLYTEGYEESLQEYDELSNTVIELKDCPFTDEGMSSYMVYVSFYDKDLNYHMVGFAGEQDQKNISKVPFDIKEIELKSGSPTKVAFETTEHAVLDLLDGGDDSFSAFFLVDIFEEYVTEETNLLYYTLDTRLLDYYEETPIATIPLWVSSDMYDVEVVYSNYGEELETYSDRKNIKAGTWLICSGILQGDGEAYSIKFKLEDGTEKEIYITTSEADDAKLINGYVIGIR